MFVYWTISASEKWRCKRWLFSPKLQNHRAFFFLYKSVLLTIGSRIPVTFDLTWWQTEILFLQFDCCGTINATDWTTANYPGIPVSCCDNIVGAIGSSNCTLDSMTLHKEGCMYAFARFAEKHAGKIAGVGIGVGVIQVPQKKTSRTQRMLWKYSNTILTWLILEQRN